ncbi:MAG: ribulose-phosphate 3-epimerase [bacterium]|jgi:ribulose-phosphate 3-epimerase
MIKIAPSILSADFANLLAEVRRAEAGGADRLHIDVMDGHFVPNITLGPVVIQALRGKTSLPLDVHLMIAGPERYLTDFVAAGAASLTVHVEACTHLHRTLQAVRALGVRAGAALNPATPPEALAYVLDEIDDITVMTVNPGFGGQDFLPAVLPKIRRVKEMIAARNRAATVTVDGGVNPATVRAVAAAGADIAVAGSAVYGQTDVAAAIRHLKELGRV